MFTYLATWMCKEMRLNIALVFALVCLIGCSGEDKVGKIAAELNKSNIQKVSNAFTLYGNMNNFQSPKDKGELIDYIKTSPHIEYNLGLMGIDPNTFEELFVSSVDGEEFVIRYKSRVTAMRGGVPIAFEKTGVDGIRRVGLSNGKIVEADKKTYDRLMKGKVSKDEAGATAEQAGGGIDSDLSGGE